MMPELPPRITISAVYETEFGPMCDLLQVGGRRDGVKVAERMQAHFAVALEHLWNEQQAARVRS